MDEAQEERDHDRFAARFLEILRLHLAYRLVCSS